MTWGDGINPENKKYKGQGSNTNLNTVIIMLMLFIIAISVSYIAFSKYQHKKTEYSFKKTEKNLYSRIKHLDKNQTKQERKVIYTSNRDKDLKVGLKLLTKQPQYPKSALKQGHEGFVTYKVDLGSYGTKQDIKLAKSSGYESLDSAAMKAINQSVFTSSILHPEESTLYITCGFQSEKAYCQY